MAFSKKGKPHILLPTPEDQGPIEDDEYDEHEYLGVSDEDMLGACDCGFTYVKSDGINHCTTDGSCWTHCNDPMEHVLVQMKEQGVPEGTDLPPEWKAYVHTLTSTGISTPDEYAAGDGDGEIVPPEDHTLGQALAQQEEPELIDHVMRKLGATEVSRDATASEIVGLYLTKVWLTGESLHAEVVAYSEGTSLKVHRARNPECATCASLACYDKALDILRVQAKGEVEAVEQQMRQQQFAQMRVCVECGKPPVGGRTYSLDEGEGFMCANCCGPHLIMDDGQPGNPWEKGDE